MVSESKATEWILDRDGSCRDVTFTPTKRIAVEAFLSSMVSKYRIESALDYNGIDRANQLRTDDPLLGFDGYVHIILAEGGGIIPQLQIFIDEEEDPSKLGVEVTFFPQDIDLECFSLPLFMALIDTWNELLQSDDYFVRYENASWELYDSAGLGVIYTRKLPPVA